MSIDVAITLLFGPPYNRTLEEISWMTRRQISKLALSHRDKDGILDIDMVEAEERALKKEEVPSDPYEYYRSIRRQQGVPDYLITKEIREREESYAVLRQQRMVRQNALANLSTKNGSPT